MNSHAHTGSATSTAASTAPAPAWRRVAAHPSRRPWHALAATLALAWAGTAGAAVLDGSYTVLAYEAGADQDMAGHPVDSDPTGTSASNHYIGATAQMLGNSFNTSSSDSSHWTLGPAGYTLADYLLHPAGTPGTYITRQVTVEVGMEFAPGLDTTATDYNLQGSFSAEFNGNIASQSVSGGVIAVNCNGCGGLINGGSGDFAADGSLNQIYTLQATYEAGLDSGRLRLSLGWTGGGMGNTQAWMRLLSITDPVTGAAHTYQNLSTGAFMPTAVPEPEGYALMLAGLAALGTAAKRQRKARSAQA